MVRKQFVWLVLWCWTVSLFGTETVSISHPATWQPSSLSGYVGRTVTFDVPFYIISNYGGRYTVSPSRKNLNGAVSISGLSDVIDPDGNRYHHRLGERIVGLTVQVRSTSSLTYKSGTFVGNSRADLLQGWDPQQINARGRHTLLVCAANLEYYLVQNFGTGFGPANQAAHDRQRQKVSKALALINADIYGFVEIEQGQKALDELAHDMNVNHPERGYKYIDDGGSASGSYTKSGFVFDTLAVTAVGTWFTSNSGVRNRKYMQCFRENATGEKFIFSINHFKAMTGGGDTEATRITEANAVNNLYETCRNYYKDDDVLIMGDLNCYKDETPITILLKGGTRTDLHRYFHADSSYSYVFDKNADYLDHAIANATLLPQVTGMQAFHINSDESDEYTYDKSDDVSMFRYSDHDPILVGLRLNSKITNDMQVLNYGDNLHIMNGKGGYVRVYGLDGSLLYEQTITTNEMDIDIPLRSGIHIVHIYHNGVRTTTKYLKP